MYFHLTQEYRETIHNNSFENYCLELSREDVDRCSKFLMEIVVSHFLFIVFIILMDLP